MNVEMVTSLFSLFSGEEEIQRHMPLLTAAMQEVLSSLCRPEDAREVRLCYLAAAIANLRYTQMYGAREKALATYAGTVARQSDAQQQMYFAEQLVSSYQALCSELLVDRRFCFVGIGGK